MLIMAREVNLKEAPSFSPHPAPFPLSLLTLSPPSLTWAFHTDVVIGVDTDVIPLEIEGKLAGFDGF